jgi:hypothetical protein
MKSPVLDINSILARIEGKVSADTLKAIRAGEIVPVQKIYRFAKNLSGLSGIQKLYDDTKSKTTGVTNIEKAKFDNDLLLLGIGLEVAFSAANLNSDALIAAADFSNKVLAPAAFTDSDLATATITSLRASAALRIEPNLRNSLLKYSVAGKDIFEGFGDDLLADGFATNTEGVNADFQNFLSLLQSPRVVKASELVTPTLEIPAAVANYYAVRINHFVIELKSAN